MFRTALRNVEFLVSLTFVSFLFSLCFFQLMQEVASALAFMHGVGVVHADLKPEVPY